MPAPKGNQFACMNVGTITKPPKYNDPIEYADMIAAYFAQADERPTISGMALWLGFASRQSIYDMIDKNANKDISYITKRAVLHIEHFHEIGMYENANAGHIFWLKNRGWTDRQEIEHSGSSDHKVIKWTPAK